MPDTYIRNIRAAPGSAMSNVTTQTLNAGDNTINHALGQAALLIITILILILQEEVLLMLKLH